MITAERTYAEDLEHPGAVCAAGAYVQIDIVVREDLLQHRGEVGDWRDLCAGPDSNLVGAPAVNFSADESTEEVDLKKVSIHHVGLCTSQYHVTYRADLRVDVGKEHLPTLQRLVEVLLLGSLANAIRDRFYLLVLHVE